MAEREHVAGLLRAPWWRFDRYEIIDGFIGPAQGAQGESYDPWAEYLASRDRGTSSDPPYRSLINLSRRLQWEVEPDPRLEYPLDVRALSSPRLTPYSASLLTEWCCERGLLGLLSELTLTLTPPPRGVALVFPERGVADLGVHFDEYQRIAGSWAHRHTSLHHRPDTARATIDRLVDRAVLCPQGNSPPLHYEGVIPAALVADLDLEFQDASFRPAGALLPGATTLNGWERHASVVSCFFPSALPQERETFQYPLPLTPEFWALYAEPVALLAGHAQALAGIVTHLGAVPPANVAPSVVDDQENPVVWFNRYLSSASPALQVQRNKATMQIWNFPSLLSAYAMMIMQDFTEKRRLRTCEACGSVFLSAAYQARYCSVTCRNRVQKRNQREYERQRQLIEETKGDEGA